MRPAIITLIIVLMSAIPSVADDATGGYSYSSAAMISYLHLVQRGNGVTGYIQSVLALPSAAGGTQVVSAGVAGNVQGRSIQLQVGQQVMDGTCGSGNVSLETPVSGYVARLIYRRTSVDAWNHMVAAFTKKQAQKLQIQRERAVQAQEAAARADQDEHYRAAVADRPFAKQQLDQAIADQKQGQKALKDAQAAFDSKLKSWQDQKAAVIAKAAEAKDLEAKGDEKGAEAAAKEATDAVPVVNQAHDNAQEAEKLLITIRDNPQTGLPAADQAVNDATARLTHDDALIQDGQARKSYAAQSGHAPAKAAARGRRR